MKGDKGFRLPGTSRAPVWAIIMVAWVLTIMIVPAATWYFGGENVPWWGPEGSLCQNPDQPKTPELIRYEWLNVHIPRIAWWVVGIGFTVLTVATMSRGKDRRLVVLCGVIASVAAGAATFLITFWWGFLPFLD